jgi:DNA-binding NtrC family response regulator
MEHLRRKIGKLGPSDLWVHLFGETGTGKENVARALHELSARSRRPFVAVNAAGFTDELLVAELFGHTRGAFTGAVAAREGYVAQAEGGTLFVDEVAEMSPVTQARLLRFLEQKEYQRLGETETRHADVRVISATNVDLAERVRAGLFRKDMWFRFKHDLIVLPPLRERGDDVLLLARHFLSREAARRGEAPAELSAETEAALLRHEWPGNVRELRNEMQRLAVLAAGRPVELRDLSEELRSEKRGPASCLREALRRAEADLVRLALDRHGWIVARAAAELGITRQALWAKVRRLGLVVPGS